MSTYSLIQIITILFQVYKLMLFARIISSWFPINRSHQLYRLLYSSTEPVLAPFRDLFYKYGLMRSGFDFSPIAALFALNFIERFLIRLVMGM